MVQVKGGENGPKIDVSGCFKKCLKQVVYVFLPQRKYKNSGLFSENRPTTTYCGRTSDHYAVFMKQFDADLTHFGCFFCQKCLKYRVFAAYQGISTIFSYFLYPYLISLLCLLWLLLYLLLFYKGLSVIQVCYYSYVLYILICGFLTLFGGIEWRFVGEGTIKEIV